MYCISVSEEPMFHLAITEQVGVQSNAWGVLSGANKVCLAMHVPNSVLLQWWQTYAIAPSIQDPLESVVSCVSSFMMRT